MQTKWLQQVVAPSLLAALTLPASAHLHRCVAVLVGCLDLGHDVAGLHRNDGGGQRQAILVKLRGWEECREGGWCVYVGLWVCGSKADADCCSITACCRRAVKQS